MEQTIPVKYAARWLARMAAADGVVSPNERNLLAQFAKTFDIEARSLFRMAYALANKVVVPEVEYVNEHEMKGLIFEAFVVSFCSDKSRFKLISWRSNN